MADQKPTIPATEHQKKDALQAEALTDYLDSLLSKATEPESTTPQGEDSKTAEKDLSIIDESKESISAKSMSDIDDGTEPAEGTGKTENDGSDCISRINSVVFDKPKVQVDFIISTIQSDEFKQNLAEQWKDNGRPAWAQSRFDCLLFDVGEFQLAAPLVTLGTIIKKEKPFTRLAGQPDWFMGLLKSDNTNVQVVNTAKWLMPDQYDPEFQENVQFVITLIGHEWGLACSAVQNAVQMEPEDVKWRSSHNTRPWVAGTVIDKMCSILDIETLRVILANSDFQQ